MIYALVLTLASGATVPVSEHRLPQCLNVGEAMVSSYGVGPMGPVIVRFDCVEVSK